MMAAKGAGVLVQFTACTAKLAAFGMDACFITRPHSAADIMALLMNIADVMAQLCAAGVRRCNAG